MLHQRVEVWQEEGGGAWQILHLWMMHTVQVKVIRTPAVAVQFFCNCLSVVKNQGSLNHAAQKKNVMHFPCLA